MKAAVILAGGQSTRMGGGLKPLLKLGGRRILDHVLERLKPQVDHIAINANQADPELISYNLPLLPDLMAGHLGPLAGVHAALTWGESLGLSHVLTVAGDTPFFPEDIYAELEKGRKDQAIAMAATGAGPKDWHPTFALWPTSAHQALSDALQTGTRKVMAFSEALGTSRVIFEQSDPFFNINRPEDLIEARKRLEP